MQKKLLFLSFVEGAAVMAAELCGARLLAPIFGSSLYVWASVMGITLAALAGGYFFGGRITASTKVPFKRLFQVLVLASLFLLLMPVLSYYLIPRISYLPFLLGMVISTVILLFPPVFALGASSPLFIAVQTKDNDLAGKVSGTVYAVSTAGGIVATFLCGFWLIPGIGLSACLLLFGGLLLVASSIILKILRIGYLLLAFAFVYLNVQFLSIKTNYLLESDSVLGHLEILDISRNKQAIRLLRINNIIQTEMDLDSKRSVSHYVQLLDTLIPPTNREKQALVLGLGGGLTANLLRKKHYHTEGVELDARIVDAAKFFFFLDKQVTTVCTDARYFLNSCDHRYDLMLVDIFRAEEQPSHVLTLESLKQLKKNLADSSRLLINWHGYTNTALGKGTAVLYNTLKAAGFKVHFCAMLENEDQRNLVFVASYDDIGKQPFEISEPLAKIDQLNTDDQPVLEKYNALANKAWRTNYLRYYQQGTGF